MPAHQPQEHTELIARGLLLHGSKVLLCRNTTHGYSYLPGGHIEFAEPAAIALARELHEELALSVSVGPLLLVTEEHFTTGHRPHHELNLVFHVEHPGPLTDVRSQEPDIAFDWLELAALTETDLRPTSIKAWLLAGGPDQTPTASWSGMSTPR